MNSRTRRISRFALLVGLLTLTIFIRRATGQTSAARPNPKSAPAAALVPNSPLDVAIQKHDLVAAKVLLEASPELVRSRNDQGSTPLHLAAGEGNPEMLSLLLEYGASLNAQSVVHHTPLNDAILGGHLEAAALLLARGASVNHTNHQGATPLHIAAMLGNIKAAELLLANGADLKHPNAWGVSPLGAAVMTGRTAMLAFLLERGADARAKGANQTTLLHLVSRFADDEQTRAGFESLFPPRSADTGN